MLDLSLPAGLRDLLPDHSAHLAELSGRLHDVFSSFGYRRVLLPTLERLEVVELGLSSAAAASVLKFVEPGSGDVVAIRPDITPQIARLYASRPDALPSPARLCYDGPVLRAREERAGRPREVYQAGVELLGEGGARADAEALAVLARALDRAREVARVAPGAARALAEVEAALQLARRRGLGEVVIDLGEVRGLGYYTGITFAGYAPGAGSAVAAGGRYDGLLAKFGRPGPAIGFAVDLEFATQALERAGVRRRSGRAPVRRAARASAARTARAPIRLPHRR